MGKTQTATVKITFDCPASLAHELDRLVQDGPFSEGREMYIVRALERLIADYQRATVPVDLIPNTQ